MKSKLLFFIAIAFVFMAFAPLTQAAGDINCPFTIEIKGNTICVDLLTKTDFGTTYYSVYLPLFGEDSLAMTLGVKDNGIMNLNQIQQKSNLLWGGLFSFQLN